MNSLLQALYMTPEFRYFVYRWNHDATLHGPQVMSDSSERETEKGSGCPPVSESVYVYAFVNAWVDGWVNGCA